MPADRPDVVGIKNHIARQLTLHVQAVLHGPTRLEVLVEGIQISTVELAHCLIVRISDRHIWIVFERDKRVETAVNVDGTRTVTKKARVAEVEAPGTPQEREKPVGNDGGYLWRLYSYWRVLERDGGTYVQCESISLTRDIPLGFGWLVRPFVTSIPRESLEFTLTTTRNVLGK